MTPLLESLCDQLQAAKDALEKAILVEMDKVARKHHLDEMRFLFFTTFTRNGEEVEDKEIKHLQDIYWDHINDCGFQAIWTRNKGWMV